MSSPRETTNATELPLEKGLAIWFIVLVAAGLITMGVSGFLAGLRYYASSCAPGAPKHGSAALCSRAAEWRAP